MNQKLTPPACSASLEWLLQRVSDRVAAMRERAGSGREEPVRQPVG